MKKVKKFLNSLAIVLVMAGALVCGSMLVSHQTQPKADQTYQDLTNDLPEYFSVRSAGENASAWGNNDLFLLGADGKISVSMTNGFVENEGSETVTKRNPAYFPDAANENEYYYFGNFANPISLYFNLTNEEVLSGSVDQNLNLLKDQPTTAFAGRNNEDFFNDENVSSYSTVSPMAFEMTFSLNSAGNQEKFTPNGTDKFETDADDIKKFVGTNIELYREGYYTLVIPYDVLHVIDGRVEMSSQRILFTFMVFNSETYLKAGQPDIEVPSFMQTSAISRDGEFSNFYFFNFDDAPSASSETKTDGSSMPYLRYNPEHYDIAVKYVDIDENEENYTFSLDATTRTLKVTDQAGNEAQDCPILFQSNVEQGQKATLYFNELGVYDFSFSFIFKNADRTFNLPITKPKQRLYIYGYQAFYTTTERDQNNMTQSKELKKFGADASVDFGKYEKSADITSKLNLSQNQRTTAQPTIDGLNGLKDAVLGKLNEKKDGELAILPISTNQTPVKFRKNAGVTRTASYFYEVTTSSKTQGDKDIETISLGTAHEFVGDNFSDAGTWLVIVTYQFNDFLTENGTMAAKNYHYQVFYFTISNRTPTVTIKTMKNGQLQDVFVDGYTNQDVYIVDNSAGADYDASVTLTLSAQNHDNSALSFQNVNFLDFQTQYEGIEFSYDLGTAFGQESLKGLPGIKITAGSTYSNAKFTVQIKSATIQTPSENYFTIDTTPIGEIAAQTATAAGTSYTTGLALQSGQSLTNQPLFFGWNEKNSGAQTYAYYKHFPISDCQYYKAEDASNPNSGLLRNLLELNGHSGVLPVNSILNLTNASDWTLYANAKDFLQAKSVPSSFVRSAPGLYLFEIYDDAGNFTFQTFFIDNTAPVFVKYTTVVNGGSSSLSVLSDSDTITVSDEFSYKILWGSKKGIYIKGVANTGASDYLSADVLGKMQHYQYDGLSFAEGTDPARQAVYDFFADNSMVINNLLGSTSPSPEITSYNGRYVTIKILDDAYVREPNSDNKFYRHTTIQPSDAENFAGVNVYDIKLTFTTDDGQVVANEGDYKFLVRDFSNTKLISTDTLTDPTKDMTSVFTSAPSGYLTVTLSSDASKLTFWLARGQNNQTRLSISGYSDIGRFYQDSEQSLHKNKLQQSYAETNYTYRYQYYSPINSTASLTLSYIPYAQNDSRIDELTLEYYPFVKTYKQISYQDRKGEGETYDVYAYYYTLSQLPTRKETIFKLTDENKGTTPKDEGGDEQDNPAIYYFDLATLGSTAEPGKYVFKRTYSLSEGTSINKYDYYERTLTLIIDRYDIISDIESVDNPNDGDKAVESVVGGDIMISMYDRNGYDEYAITFPSYSKDSHLNDNNTFYSGAGDNMSEGSVVSPALTSNKLPVALKVPKYKYTLYNNFSKDLLSYKVEINSALSYYGDYAVEASEYEGQPVWNVFTAVVYKEVDDLGEDGRQQFDASGNVLKKTVVDHENSKLIVQETSEKSAWRYVQYLIENSNSSIAEYELSAKIEFSPSASQAASVYYYSNGRTNDGNYLLFYRSNSSVSDLPTDESGLAALQTDIFTAPGTYTVTLYQAANQDALSMGEGYFARLYKFAFKIEQSTPDFDILSGSEQTLDSVTNAEGIERFYTNDKNFQVRWTDSASQYMAKIDQSNITFQFYNQDWQNGPYRTLSSGALTIESDESSGRTHWINYHFEDNEFQNGNFVRVSMRFEGSDRYYTTVSKDLVIDYTAPTERLASLMDKTTRATTNSNGAAYFGRLFQERNMRTLLKADNSTISLSSWTENNLASKMMDVSYSYTAGTGNYRYYTYTVGLDFFTDALAELASARTNPTDTQTLYFREIEQSPDGLFENYQQTTRESFSPQNTEFDRLSYLDEQTNSIANIDQLEDILQDGTYYEVVETDKAGNMVVYIIFYQSAASGNALTFTNDRLSQAGEEDKAVTNAEIADGFNIYSNSGFMLTSLNYNNDIWGFYRIVINGISTYYMSSPWITEPGQIYRLGSGEPTLVALSDIFAQFSSSSSKQSIFMSNRTTGRAVQVYLSITDETLELRHYTQDNTATLEILDVPTLAQINSNRTYVFPTEIQIAYWDSNGWNFEMTTLANGEKSLKNPSGDPNNWAILNESPYLNFTYANGRLSISVSRPNNVQARLKYLITDNFGYTITELQLVGEVPFNEIESNGVVYSFNDIVENGQFATTYMSNSTISYQYNSVLYNAEVTKGYQNGVALDESRLPASEPVSNGIRRITLNSTIFGATYDVVYFINVYENDAPEQDTLKTVILRIYNDLPVLLSQDPTEENTEHNIWFVNKEGQTIQATEATIPSLTVNFNGQTLTSRAQPITTFSSLVVLNVDDGRYSSQYYDYLYQQKYPYNTFISQDGQTWTNIDSSAANGYVISEVGTYYILIKYDDITLDGQQIFSNIFNLYVLTLLNSDTISYYFHVDGMPVQPRANFKYTDGTGKGYDTVYVLPVFYRDKDARVNIEKNKEKNTVMSYQLDTNPALYGSTVRVELWTYNSDISSDGQFAVIYIGSSDAILRSLGYQTALGTTEDLLQSQTDDWSNPQAIISHDSGYSQLKVSYSNYFGIKENAINVQVQKWFNNGSTSGYYDVVVKKETYKTDTSVSYFTLTRAGEYRFRFYDSCGEPNANTQMFGNSEWLYLNFISSVPFTVTYTDPLTETQVVTEPVNRAVYNGAVILTPSYQNDYFVSGYPIIHVTKDGQPFNVTSYNRQYTFTQTGYYVVYFEALSRGSNQEQQQVRTENYSFSIINANESRSEYEFSNYSNYYIERILRDGVDVTARFASILDTDTITVNGKTYLTNLRVSYYDEKTVGATDRRFVVTVRTGEQAYANTAPTFTFAFRINIAAPKIDVSIDNGGSTTGTIYVTFNARELYEKVGDMRIVLPGYSNAIVIDESALSETDTRSYSVTALGTNYILAYTASGNLIFSHKFTRNQPLNAWTIIAIVIGVIALAVIIFIAIKLRKRLKVK